MNITVKHADTMITNFETFFQIKKNFDNQLPPLQFDHWVSWVASFENVSMKIKRRTEYGKGGWVDNTQGNRPTCQTQMSEV